MHNPTILALIILLTLILVSHAPPHHSNEDKALRLLQKHVKPLYCDGLEISEFDEKQKTNADQVLKSVPSRDQNYFVRYIERHKNLDRIIEDYIYPSIRVATPWFILAGCCIIILILYFFCCTDIQFLKKRLPNKVMQIRRSSTHRGRAFFMLGSLILGCGLILFSFLGFHRIKGFSTASRNIGCEIATVIDIILYGDKEIHWMGFKNGFLYAEPLLTAYNTILYSLYNFTDEFKFLKGNYKDSVFWLNYTYLEYHNATIIRPDPALESNYSPAIIQKLGPIDNQTSQLGIIKQELDYLDNINTQAKYFMDQIMILLGVQIEEAISEALAADFYMKVATGEAEMILNTTGSYEAQLRTGTETFEKFTRIIYCINGGFAILCVAGILLLRTRKRMLWNRLLFIIIWFWALLSIIFWGLAAGLYVGAIDMKESCLLIDRLLTDKPFFNSTIALWVSNEPEVLNNCYYCFFIGGYALDQYDVLERLTIFEDIPEVPDSDSSSGSHLILPSSKAIPNFQSQIIGYKENSLVDSEIEQDLSTLNSYTLDNIRNCTSVRDRWVLSSSTCDKETAFPKDANSTFAYKGGNETCIGFDTWIKTGNKIEERYTADAFPSTCGKVGNWELRKYLQMFVNNFVKNRKQTEALYSQMLTDLNKVAIKTNAIFEKQKTMVPPYGVAREQGVIITDLLAGVPNGMLNNSNCSFAREAFHNVRDKVCIGLLPIAYDGYRIALVTASLTMLNVLFILVVVHKTRRIRRLEKTKGTQEKEVPRAVELDILPYNRDLKSDSLDVGKDNVPSSDNSTPLALAFASSKKLIKEPFIHEGPPIEEKSEKEEKEESKEGSRIEELEGSKEDESKIVGLDEILPFGRGEEEQEAEEIERDRIPKPEEKPEQESLEERDVTLNLEFLKSKDSSKTE